MKAIKPKTAAPSKKTAATLAGGVPEIRTPLKSDFASAKSPKAGAKMGKRK